MRINGNFFKQINTLLTQKLTRLKRGEYIWIYNNESCKAAEERRPRHFKLISKKGFAPVSRIKMCF